MRDIIGLARVLDRTPKQREYREHGRHSPDSAKNEFGTWNEALEACGLELNFEHNTRIPVECEVCGTVRKKKPSKIESSEYNYCSPECVSEHKKERYSGDGNPRSTLKEVECVVCGERKPRPRWHREQADKHFCGFGCWGDWVSENRTGEDNPRWSDLPTETYYGYDWPEKRLGAIVRDQARCQNPDCGISEAEYRKKHDRGLEVHHRKPLAEFRNGDSVDFESAHQLSNLVTVCRACHRRVESGSVMLPEES